MKVQIIERHVIELNSEDFKSESDFLVKIMDEYNGGEFDIGDFNIDRVEFKIVN